LVRAKASISSLKIDEGLAAAVLAHLVFGPLALLPLWILAMWGVFAGREIAAVAVPLSRRA